MRIADPGGQGRAARPQHGRPHVLVFLRIAPRRPIPSCCCLAFQASAQYCTALLGRILMSFRSGLLTTRTLAVLCVLAGGSGPGGASAAQTLKAIKERGAVTCGVSQGVIGFSFQSEKGDWSGIDVDFCRALAAAIFNDPSKVKFVALSAEERFRALQSRQVDLLSRNSSWTMSRETELGLAFTSVNFYDGQSLM